MSTAQATLAQGNTSFAAYVAMDGMEQSWTERCVSSVVLMDGTLRKTWVKKRVLTVKLRDMYHEDLTALFTGISDLASWSYLDADSGAQTKDFYLTGPTARQTLARNGLTLCTGISFELEEK